MLASDISGAAQVAWTTHHKPAAMTRAPLAIILLLPLTVMASFSALPLFPSNNTSSDTNITAGVTRVFCEREQDQRPLSDFSTCVPSLFSLYATPLIHTLKIWDPGETQQWGPETNPGGCYILVHGGFYSDVFAVESLLAPAIVAVNKCFVGAAEARNILARTKVGPGQSWWLSVVLKTTGVGGNDTSS